MKLKQIILAAALFTVAGLAMESAGVTDTLAYALMGYLVGFLGWAR